MDSQDTADEAGSTATPWQRPQALLLNFLAAHLLGRDEAVYSASLIDVLAKVGVGEHAARSTLSRMTRRGLLERHRSGKRVYLGLTEYTAGVLQEGGTRVRQAVNREWDGHWTVLGFSLPETRRSDRHLLRSRLAWAGFGPLQNGLWITPREVDLDQLLEGLDVADHVKAFRATTLHPTDIQEMIAETWDLEELAEGYRGFLHRWDIADPLASSQDVLPRQLLMHTEWTLLLRKDPGLPVEHLPRDWPAVRAEHVFLRMRSAFAPQAEREVDALVERIALPTRDATDPRDRQGKRTA
ncbi:phenylacetic acid degradation operon negative regulatory protein [Saccharomonospora amisosensis]|uniref:Phenylacetic acid degradation operon negative regulatory protein n=1 Tax=Saccharomonospora amisosensis TaxID=1128677 RepID=A0A7X5ULG8_9PSEU|nr:PaaX family transcriptional regulator C-terminal domain-containing protein [Saccharomonospora amisosensis]NIJ10191.1 phenylacetic acid degradation operon negative regulatory protein [Saccharomonospora amisosensis]